MNVDAEIVLSEANDVLSVSNAAVSRGNKVLVTKDSPSAANALSDETAPDGYVYVEVTTGVSDDDYIEITDGLQERRHGGVRPGILLFLQQLLSMMPAA
jgi:HlyD family secretion protein